MIGSYGEESAMSISTAILRKMNFNSEAEKLQEAHPERKTAAPSTSSSASTPAAAPASISAQQGSVVIAPNVTNVTSGSWNITINKS
ncbi:unnamed protein product [Pleuronectes platessa]|uniref:Uncharacterized protein n=1 Tax=Pleuronectes platessa TaxID=8262 RepID=A0A9N7URS8_PLEPL|nr:unnamed protein product [Pleuronectes platessa]